MEFLRDHCSKSNRSMNGDRQTMHVDSIAKERSTDRPSATRSIVNLSGIRNIAHNSVPRERGFETNHTIGVL